MKQNQNQNQQTNKTKKKILKNIEIMKQNKPKRKKQIINKTKKTKFVIFQFNRISKANNALQVSHVETIQV